MKDRLIQIVQEAGGAVHAGSPGGIPQECSVKRTGTAGVRRPAKEKHGTSPETPFLCRKKKLPRGSS